MSKVYRYTKLGQESTFKEALNTADLVLYAKNNTIAPVHNEIEIKEGYQRGAHRVGAGFTSASVESEFAADFNILTFLLRYALSGYLLTPGETDIHEFYTNEAFVLDSFQVVAGMDDHEAQSRGVGVNTLSIGVSNGEMNVALSAIGSTYEKTDTDNTLTADSFNNLDFLTFADVQVLLDGVDISCPETKDFTININNGMSAEDAQRVGSRERCMNLAGELEVTVDFTMYKNTTQFLESFLGGVDTFGDDGATVHKLDFVITDPATAEVLTITIPAARITSYGYSPSGNDIVDESLTFKANLGNVTASDLTVLETLIYAIITKTLDYSLSE